MNRNLKNAEDRALVMHYYAYLNEKDVVETVVALPSVISDPSYIEIPTNDQSLVGKKYNRETGEFEDIMFYYAVLDARDLVVQVIALEAQVTESNKIEIPTYDQSLVGKWYDREKGTFSAPPIHILAKMNTGEINTLKADGTPADKWLHTELSDLTTNIAAVNTGLGTQISNVNTQLNAKISASETAVNAKIVQTDNKISEVDGRLGSRISEVDARLSNKIPTVDSLGLGAYKSSFKIRNNEEILESWVENGKTFTFNFDTGIPGYFPKMIRLIEESYGNDLLVADFYLVRNPDGTVKFSYSDQNFIGTSINGTSVERIVRHDAAMHDRDDVFTVGYVNGKYYNEGGQYFVQTLYQQDFSYAFIGYFTYNENSFSFTFSPSSELVGKYTSMSLTAYIY